MTNKTAMEKLQVYSSTNGSGRCSQDEHAEAKKIALEAMGYREAKRLNNLRRHVDHDSGLCPVCGSRNTTYGEVNYCFSCGQALDWSDPDEK